MLSKFGFNSSTYKTIFFDYSLRITASLELLPASDPVQRIVSPDTRGTDCLKKQYINPSRKSTKIQSQEYPASLRDGEIAHKIVCINIETYLSIN